MTKNEKIFLYKRSPVNALFSRYRLSMANEVNNFHLLNGFKGALFEFTFAILFLIAT